MPNPNLPADPTGGLDLPRIRLEGALAETLSSLDGVFAVLDDAEGYDDEERGTAVRDAI
jgi:hypothetical protein